MRPSRAYNPEPRPRSIIKLQYLGSNRYLVQGPGRSGIQYRPRRGIPEPIRNALDAEGVAFAFAYVDRNGRWRLDSLAPKQPW